MRTDSHTPAAEGFSLPLVMVFTGVLFLMLSAVLAWTTTNSNLTQRYNEYYDMVAAAEAATEKVIASLASDFQNAGVGGVDGNLANYGASIPTPGEVSDWANYQFNDPSGAQNATYVSKLTAWRYTDLNWKYSGFQGYASTYRIISNARNTASRYNITSAVKQEIQIASIPLFEFGVFYALDMEICPSASDLTFSGWVHGNGAIYCQPESPRTVTFLDHVTAAQKILPTNSPADPTSQPLGTIVYQAEHDWNVSSLNLPLGTNNNPVNLHALIEVPPASEPVNSLMGQQRYYNKADLIILVSNNVVVARTGANNGFQNLATNYITNFMRIDGGTSFFNKRENKWIQYTEIDIGGFINQYANLIAQIGHAPTNLYVADLRTQSANSEPGLKIINGQTLPAAGLTIATCNPMYVNGHYNAPNSSLGTTNTTQTSPASLVGDAITILSGRWNDANSGGGLSSRVATNTTVNAAILSGIVPSDGINYSGGVENYLRLLEDWSSRTLTFNGSMVALYPSQVAAEPWGVPWVYSPPQQRAYSFDANFRNENKLPPGTPQLRTVIRGVWNITQANSTQ